MAGRGGVTTCTQPPPPPPPAPLRTSFLSVLLAKDQAFAQLNAPPLPKEPARIDGILNEQINKVVHPELYNPPPPNIPPRYGVEYNGVLYGGQGKRKRRRAGV